MKQQTTTKHIGILGGMGPQASALLHTRIVQAYSQLNEVTECHEYPLITHVSIPARDFISDPEQRHQNTSLVKNAVKTLQVVPVDVAIIACNTAHMLIDEIPELTALPLVSLPATAARQATQNGEATIGLIASPVTISSGLYDEHIRRYGAELIVPSNQELETAEALIRDIIAGQQGSHIQGQLQVIIDGLLARGAERVILGCTELSVIMNGVENSLVIDPLSASAQEIITRLTKHEEALA